MTTNIEYIHSHQFHGVHSSAVQPDGSIWMAYGEAADPWFQLRVFVDAPVLQSALDWVTSYPETWNQSTWFDDLPEGVTVSASPAPECGTAACLAGTISLQQGGVPVGAIDVQYEDAMHAAPDFAARVLLRVVERGPFRTGYDEFDNDELLAGVLLGSLWSGDNSLMDLWAIGEVLCPGQLTVPSREVIEAADRRSMELFSLPNGDYEEDDYDED